MEAEEQDQDLAPEQRAAPQLAVEGTAILMLLKYGASLPCRVLDLRAGGCRIEAEDHFNAGLGQRVEVSFKLRGLTARFIGTTRWTDGGRQVGIQFEEMSERRRSELVEILRELEEERAAAAARRAAESAAEAEAERESAAEAARAQDAAEIDRGHLVAITADPKRGDSMVEPAAAVESPEAEERLAGPDPPLVEEQPAAAQPAGPSLRERRAQPRHEVDTSAVILLVHGGARLHGRIRDLSTGGCRICTNEPFPVGIYTRVETEFYLRGLPVRLGGVVQAIHDRRHVGIRFLDVSDRKRQQVEDLVAELREMEEIQKTMRSSKGGGTADEVAGGAEASA